jgi:hypothetical protein
MSYVKDFLGSTIVKRFAWTALAGFLALVLAYVANLDFWWVPVATAVISGITKELNSKSEEAI